MCLVKRLLSFSVLVATIALPRMVMAQAVTCPEIIAERSGGVYYPKKNFRCFSKSSAAKRAGFQSSQTLLRTVPSFSGWWRLGVAVKSSSCNIPGGVDNTPTTIFLQLSQNEDGIIGTMCPVTGGIFAGNAPRIGENARTEGFSISSRVLLKQDPDCEGTQSETVYSFDAKNFDASYNKAAKVLFRSIKYCPNSPSTFRCSTVWEGKAGRETPNHKFWPEIPTSLDQFAPACATALTKCSGCHGSL